MLTPFIQVVNGGAIIVARIRPVKESKYNLNANPLSLL